MPWRDAVALLVLALIVRTAAALLVDTAPYTDPAYYTVVASQIASGHGFTTPVLWSFLEVGGRLPAEPMLPVASNGHWMPLTSLVSVPFVALLGDALGTWRAAQAPHVLLSALLVPLTYLVGWDLWRSRSVAWGGALLALLAGPLLVYYPMPANFAVFGLSGAAAVWLAIRAVRAPRPVTWLLASSLCVGVATLARVDGPLLAVAPAVAWWLRRRELGGLAGAAGIGLACLVAFTLPVLPWLLRNVAVFGTPLPSAGGHTLWITSYNEQFSIATQPSLESYLAWGPANIVGSKLAAWGELLGRTAVLLGGLFVLPFLYGLWHQRRRAELAPFGVYWLVVFLAMGLVFTFHAPKGAYYHSAPAWLPFALPLAVASLAPMATALGRWWRFLRRPATHRFLLVAGLVGALVLSLAGSAVVVAQWRTAVSRLDMAGTWLRARAGADDVVMSYDPARTWLVTGLRGVAPPFDPYPTVAQVVRAYDVDWVVVALGQGESRDPLGLWDGASATDAEGNHPSFLPAEPAFEADGVRVYQVSVERQ
ncbi:MAG TPA: hypothetical protein VF013_06090 [Candidatus Limnocylindria bacterium]